mmetsp:Transcript_3855/g.13938  ORF Transcript_3855/g.13938 Transcript_3855/m.13938 type:complete len:306 (-) Transcript_3855:196-1113(-)
MLALSSQENLFKGNSTLNAALPPGGTSERITPDVTSPIPTASRPFICKKQSAMNSSYDTLPGGGAFIAMPILRMNHAMMAKSSAESVYLTLVRGSRHVDGNSAVAKLKNEYGSNDDDDDSPPFALLLMLLLTRGARPTPHHRARARRALRLSTLLRTDDATDIAGDDENVENMITAVHVHAKAPIKVVLSSNASHSAARLGLLYTLATLAKLTWRCLFDRRRTSQSTAARGEHGVTMVLSSAFLMAVKKGPFARGGIIWKTHRFIKMSQTRQRNSAVRARKDGFQRRPPRPWLSSLDSPLCVSFS